LFIDWLWVDLLGRNVIVYLDQSQIWLRDIADTILEDGTMALVLSEVERGQTLLEADGQKGWIKVNVSFKDIIIKYEGVLLVI
jgi:hypothetical protein